jgi:hypothetical protein
MANRAQRRQAEREGRPIGVIYDTGFEEAYEGEKNTPAKVPGKHRWIAAVTYTLKDEWVRGWDDPAVVKHLDHENRIYMGIGCLDCEQALGEIEADSRCPAGDTWKQDARA